MAALAITAPANALGFNAISSWSCADIDRQQSSPSKSEKMRLKSVVTDVNGVPAAGAAGGGGGSGRGVRFLGDGPPWAATVEEFRSSARDGKWSAKSGCLKAEHIALTARQAAAGSSHRCRHSNTTSVSSSFSIQPWGCSGARSNQGAAFTAMKRENAWGGGGTCKKDSVFDTAISSTAVGSGRQVKFSS